MEEPVRNDALKHEDIIIATSPDKRLSGSNNLCAILDVADGPMNQDKQFIISYSKEWMKTHKGAPAVLPMHDEFEYNSNEEDVREHEMYPLAIDSTKSFYEIKFGDRIPQLKKPGGGIPVYIGKDPISIHVAYISADEFPKGTVPVESYPIEVVLGEMDQGKKKIKVKYINIEDDTVTITVVSMDEITDMKKLLYQIG